VQVIRPSLYESQLDVVLEWLQRVQKSGQLPLLVAMQTFTAQPIRLETAFTARESDALLV
jgi:hypothetical protein